MIEWIRSSVWSVSSENTDKDVRSFTALSSSSDAIELRFVITMARKKLSSSSRMRTSDAMRH